MFKLDDNLLIELGLGTLPPVEKNRMLSHIYETLEMRVGMKLAQKMTNEQLDEFEAFIDRSDEAGALKWLESNFPDYKQVVANELETLKQEIRTAAPQIVAASQQQAAMALQQASAGQMQQQTALSAQPQAMPQQTQQSQQFTSASDNPTFNQPIPQPMPSGVVPGQAMPQYPPSPLQSSVQQGQSYQPQPQFSQPAVSQSATPQAQMQNNQVQVPGTLGNQGSADNFGPGQQDYSAVPPTGTPPQPPVSF